jgi:hypothetical protein
MVETPRAKSTTIEISEPNYSSNRIRSLVSAGNLPEEKETAG